VAGLALGGHPCSELSEVPVGARNGPQRFHGRPVQLKAMMRMIMRLDMMVLKIQVAVMRSHHPGPRLHGRLGRSHLHSRRWLPRATTMTTTMKRTPRAGTCLSLPPLVPRVAKDQRKILQLLSKDHQNARTASHKSQRRLQPARSRDQPPLILQNHPPPPLLQPNNNLKPSPLSPNDQDH
jgi:hypothetical protein